MQDWNKINKLVKKTRKGDGEAAKQLISTYDPLIRKVSTRIWLRYKKQLPFTEIYSNAKHISICVTILEYKPKGKATYTHFLRTYLHARLVQLVRPLINVNTIPLREEIYTNLKSPYDDIYRKEKEEIVKLLLGYISKYMDDREKELIFLHVCGNITRSELARKNKVSYTRMKVIYKRCMAKLRDFLSLAGIKKSDL